MKRRSFLQGCGLAPLGLTAAGYAQAKSSAKLDVDSLEVFRVHVNRRGNWVIARLKTSGGMTGLGDASHSKNEEQVLLYLKKFSELLRGRSVFDAAWFREATKPIIRNNGAHGGGPAAVAASALEQCLFDIQGKAFSVPTYDLFGGRIQEQFRVYANINRSTQDRSPEGFAKSAASAVTAGFDAIKLAPFDGMPKRLTDGSELKKFVDLGVSCVQAVRQTVGSNRDILVDAHSHFNLEDGLDLTRRLEPLDLYWWEEVTPADPIENLAIINSAAKMPTAGGENIHGVDGFYPYIKAGAVDIVMPDVKYCGGMMELKKISTMAEGAGLLCSPHGPASPIGNAAAAHVIATVPNVEIFEFSFGEVPWRSELVYPPEEVVQGRLKVSGRPGFGYVLNEKVAAKNAVAL